VGERLKPAVLKTVRPQKGLVGSNPTPSAILLLMPFGISGFNAGSWTSAGAPILHNLCTD
jgi:hypothetical protein